MLEDESEEINLGLPVPEKEERKRALAQALINLNPELEIFPIGFKELAETENISEDEVRIKYRHLELNGSEDGNGIQITLLDDKAEITVPYSQEGTEAKEVFEEIWSYLKVLEKEGGFVTYDPQLEKILNLSTDLPLAIEIYEGVGSSFKAAFENDGATQQFNGREGETATFLSKLRGFFKRS